MDRHKLTREHLEKAAYVYVRQSSPGQLKNHRESLDMQYELERKAHDLGFRDVVVLDQDLGKSAKGLQERPAFERMVADVHSGLVGAIVCIEAPRLARNGPDWARLFQICGVLGTLIIDGDGIYNLSDANDRLVMGIKGTVSEMELRTMQQRLLGGLKNKAERCALFSLVPVGFIRVGKDRINLHPDQRIRKAIKLVFDKFDQLATGLKVYKWFVKNEVNFPKYKYIDGELFVDWVPMIYNRVLSILKNPTYAGVYCYGKTKNIIEVENGQLVMRHRTIKPEAAHVFCKDAHPGYISLGQFERNREIMMENTRGPGAKGSPQRGTALLQGLLRCKRCGILLRVSYGGKGSQSTRYSCQNKEDKGQGCFSFAGRLIEQTIAKKALEVVKPLAVEASIQALEDYHNRLDERRRILELEINEAKYEVDRAARAFRHVDPENHNVSAVLAQEWEQALQRQEDLKAKQTALEEEIRPLPEKAHIVLKELARDLPRLWRQASTTSEMKKRILRTLIEEIWVELDESKTLINSTIEWKGGACTQIQVPKRLRGQRKEQTSAEVIRLVKQLAEQMPDEQIVPALNRMSVKTGKGNTWTPSRLRALRSHHKIPIFDPQRPKGTVTLKEAAQKLDISTRQLRNLIEKGIIEASQVLPSAPWAIKVATLDDVLSHPMVKQFQNNNNGSLKKSPRTHSQKSLFE